jgi:hypothetical protein
MYDRQMAKFLHYGNIPLKYIGTYKNSRVNLKNITICCLKETRHMHTNIYIYIYIMKSRQTNL